MADALAIINPNPHAKGWPHTEYQEIGSSHERVWYEDTLPIGSKFSSAQACQNMLMDLLRSPVSRGKPFIATYSGKIPLMVIGKPSVSAGGILLIAK